ncbi:SDR family oxidoreductase [Hoeflea poritis]|uniref:Aldehyde reductase n=1 Tax=Hoeflea poritis TaxID=2993659 RepID=A0ABT4VS89_9HYPH|nr:aldehyde reductase [Hoeflea poritis]MDA4847580.1 aldehyde reductase [Hoeflea poritis]
MTAEKTIFVTGASGFIAEHIILKALEAGHYVRGSVRDRKKIETVRNALSTHLSDPKSALERLDFVELDLSNDNGWDEAMNGVDALIHPASPFPFVQPKDPNEVIGPAVEGALRALRAAKAGGVRRVVLTSSGYAMIEKDLEPGKTEYDEDDWSDPNNPVSTPYSRSKTLAEKAAWDYVAETAPAIDLTVINPGLVLGPPLDKELSTSIKVIKRLLDGRDPALPHFGFPVVDVRDVAEAHLRALDTPETIGKRIIVAEDFMWFVDMATAIKAAFPDRKIVTRVAPNWLIRILALFDAEIRPIAPVLGVRRMASNRRAKKLLGLDFIEARESAVESARFLITNGIA